jgi:hypothetical protein
MSIPVTLDTLRAELERFGAAPYLLTVADDGRPHSVAVHVAWTEEGLTAACGRRTLANLAARSLVCLLWPPFEPGGYSLIVDGEAAVCGAGEETRAIIRPTKGVMHRPAARPVSDGNDCGHDCVKVGG